jgi:hypothetical protein
MIYVILEKFNFSPLHFSGRLRYKFMPVRRVLSMSLALALCWPMVLPAWAGSCAHSSKAQMCHRVKHTSDCAMMHHMHAEESEGSESGISAVEQDPKCPMTCCMQAGPRTARPVPVVVDYTPSLLLESFAQFESQVFTASGFSSHTDRGPPALSSFTA